MKRSIIAIVIVAAAAGGFYYMRRGAAADATTAANGGGGRGGGGGGFGGGGFGGPGGGFGGFGGPRLPMTVELAPVKRGEMTESLTVVGNLIGAVTVEAVPKIGGRIERVNVQLGDRVTRGQLLAKVEDQEINEQVKQAQASFDVSAATIRQREADLRLAQTNLDRSRNLYERQLIPKQTFDDTDARYQAAAAQVDLAKAQYAQAQARLDELKINLANTNIVSPVSGFIAKRMLDPGAWVTPNSAFISVVDITVVRLVANIIEKDLRRITAGMKANVEVDAFPGERFDGRISRVAPVLDPATRTAQMEVEIANASFRLKPGMYAKVTFIVERRENILVVPANAVVDVGGKKGVFLADASDVAKFQPISLGMMNTDQAEITAGVAEGTRVITTGATALREGDRITVLGQAQGQGQGGRGGRGANGGRGEGRNPGAAAPGASTDGPTSASPPAGEAPAGARRGGGAGSL